MPKILIIDDDDSVRRSLVYFFEDLEFDTFEAATVKEALEILNNNQMDVITVDLRLPGKSGADFITENYHNLGGTVFVIITGSTNFKIPDEFESLDRLSKHIILKPIESLQNMKNEIENMLAKQRG